MIDINNPVFCRKILENIPEGIVICDDASNIVYTNRAFQFLSGLKEEEIEGRSFCSFFTESKSGCFSSSKDSKNITEESHIYQAEFIDDQGNKTPVKIIHVVYEDESVLHLNSVSLLSESLCLNQAHLDFVSTVSHELRTPLTSIKGFADTLLTAGDMLGKDQQMRFIKIIKGQVDRLTRLVEDLLTVSRLEARKDHTIYKAIELKKFFEEIIQGLKAKFPKHIFKLEIPDNFPDVWADMDKFEQIMTNLIDNGAKYSYPETTVTVKADFVANNSDYINIHVVDQGVGIPKEHLNKIFTKFSRLDNPLTREVQGTGLGLYITKALVEKMNGTVYADSNDKGSIFTIKMPVATFEKHARQKFEQEKISYAD